MASATTSRIARRSVPVAAWWMATQTVCPTRSRAARSRASKTAISMRAASSLHAALEQPVLRQRDLHAARRLSQIVEAAEASALAIRPLSAKQRASVTQTPIVRGCPACNVSVDSALLLRIPRRAIFRAATEIDWSSVTRSSRYPLRSTVPHLGSIVWPMKTPGQERADEIGEYYGRCSLVLRPL